jgi:hypothetical protein
MQVEMLVLSGRRAKKPIHDGSQKNELNGYSGALNELKELLGDAVTLVIETIEKHINCFFVNQKFFIRMRTL